MIRFLVERYRAAATVTDGDADMECGASAGFALHRDAAVHGVDDLPDERQPDARSDEVRLVAAGLVERLEKV